MTKNLLAALPTLLLAYSFSLAAYSSITPAELHERLIANDTLLILDVREWSEYTAGHIIEPAGHLPLTPACMPWTSNVLQQNFHQLPSDIDIIVHCQSGVRSPKASAFLDSAGFSRIFNLTGGIGAWNFEERTGGFGDGSGHWVRQAITRPDSLRHDSGTIVFSPASIAGMDSLYCELHFAYGKQPVPGDAPLSSIAGLFLITALNSFGLSLFSGDSLRLSDSVAITLIPRSKTGGPLPVLSQTNVTALAGPGQWKPLANNYQNPSFQVNGKVLRRWYNTAGTVPAAARQRATVSPIMQTGNSNPAFYDLRGRLIRKNYCAGLVPVISSSRYYISNTPHNHR